MPTDWSNAIQLLLQHYYPGSWVSVPPFPLRFVAIDRNSPYLSPRGMFLNRWKLLRLLSGNRLDYGYVELGGYAGWNLTDLLQNSKWTPVKVLFLLVRPYGVHIDWTFAWRSQNRYFALGTSILITFCKSCGRCVRKLITEMHGSDFWYYTDGGCVRLLAALLLLMLIQNSCKLKAFDHWLSLTETNIRFCKCAFRHHRYVADSSIDSHIVWFSLVLLLVANIECKPWAFSCTVYPSRFKWFFNIDYMRCTDMVRRESQMLSVANLILIVFR